MKSYDIIKSMADRVGMTMYCYSERPVIYEVGIIDEHGGFSEYYSGIYKEVKAYLKGRQDLLDEQENFDLKMGYTD